MHEIILADSMWADLKPYFDALDQRICTEGEGVAFNPSCSIDEWKPAVAKCHANADRWVASHPDNRAVRGWGTWGREAVGDRKFFAHSVLSEGSKLFDITPFGNEGDRRGLIFLRHIGSEKEFFDIVKRRCSFLYPQDFLQQVLSNVPRACDEDENSEGPL